MKLIPLLLELDFRTYEAMVKVTFGEEGNQGYDDALRAVPNTIFIGYYETYTFIIRVRF